MPRQRTIEKHAAAARKAKRLAARRKASQRARWVHPGALVYIAGTVKVVVTPGSTRK